MEQPNISFGKLRASGLKVNATECSFGVNNIPQLVNGITWEGIKPDPNKFQEIMDLGRPTTMTKD